MVDIGQKAPDFIAPALVDGAGTMLELFRELQQNDVLVLYFAPADFVHECTAELVAVREAGWQSVPNLRVVALSGDSLFSHAAYADQYDIPFPLVSDFHGSVAESYGLLAEKWEGHRGIPQRGTVVIGGDWSIESRDTVENPLDRPPAAPVELAGETLQSLGIDVDQPTVAYDPVS
jgi:peroxiredoxin